MEDLLVIGITVRTSNNNGQGIEDIGQLWRRFFGENIMAQIPNKMGQNIYSIYTDYESNYKGAYTTLIGVRVTSLENIPQGLSGRSFPGQTFVKFVAKGSIHEAIGTTWQKIWENDATLNRSYTYDYELYDERSQLEENAEVDIYIGVK